MEAEAEGEGEYGLLADEEEGEEMDPAAAARQPALLQEYGAAGAGAPAAPVLPRLPSDPQQAAAAAEGLRLPVLGRLGGEAAGGQGGGGRGRGGEAVLRFSELFGSTSAELRPPALLPHVERARAHAEAARRAAAAAAAAAAEEGEEEGEPEAGPAGDEVILHAEEVTLDAEGGWWAAWAVGLCAVILRLYWVQLLHTE